MQNNFEPKFQLRLSNNNNNNNNNNNRDDLDMTKKKKTWREKIKTLLIAAQNYTIRTNYIKAKIDNSQQKSKLLWSWRARNE